MSCEVLFTSFRNYLYIYSDLYICIPLAETIILYINKYIKKVDIIVVQLRRRHLLLCVHLGCPKTLGPYFYRIFGQIVLPNETRSVAAKEPRFFGFGNT